MTDCVVETADATALKPVLVAPAAIVTEAGTVKALLLLESATTVGLLAAVLKYTEHPSVVAPVSVCVPHEILLKTGVAAWAGYSVITSVFDTLPSCPAMVTLTDLLTALEVALKPALAAPDAITTVDGTLKAALLLVSVTVVGLVAAALRDTVQGID